MACTLLHSNASYDQLTSTEHSSIWTFFLYEVMRCLTYLCSIWQEHWNQERKKENRVEAQEVQLSAFCSKFSVAECFFFSNCTYAWLYIRIKHGLIEHWTTHRPTSACLVCLRFRSFFIFLFPLCFCLVFLPCAEISMFKRTFIGPLDRCLAASLFLCFAKYKIDLWSCILTA